MARVTIEDCLKVVGNNSHFDLVLIASERAKQVSNGKKSEIAKKGIKTHVTALREIEEESISLKDIRKNIVDRIHNLRTEEDEIGLSGSQKDEILEELQSSEFVVGELEEISSEDMKDDIFMEEDGLFEENEDIKK